MILTSILIRIYRSAIIDFFDWAIADDQAIARSHRYGQNKKVLVFKLMTKDSVEGKPVRSAAFKV